MENVRLKKKVMLCAVLLLLLAGVFALYCRVTAGNRLLNPLLKYKEFHELQLQPFKDKVEALILSYKKEGIIDEAAIYFRGLSDGIWFGVNEREKFVPASLLKVPLMITYFKLAGDDPGILHKKIRHTVKEEFRERNIKSAENTKPKEYLSIEELIRIMIVESDNNAAGELLAGLDPDLVARTYRELGIDIDDSQNISLKSYVGIFRVLYNASYLNKQMSERALEYLTKTSFKEGFVSSLPANIVVAHKFAERSFEDTGLRQLHEVGIIYHKQNPYLLGIMTRGRDFSKLSRAIRDISALTYQEVDRQYTSLRNEAFQINE